MLHKVADGIWCIEDVDGMPAALVTTMDDGTPLAVAEHWWTANQRLLHGLADSNTVRDWLKRQIPDGDDREDN